MNNNKLSYYQLNKNIIKLKRQIKRNNPDYKEKVKEYKREYERQYYHNKRKILNKIEKIVLLNDDEVPNYLSYSIPVVKIEYGSFILEI
jgi:hypothetical protein